MAGGCIGYDNEKHHTIGGMVRGSTDLSRFSQNMLAS